MKLRSITLDNVRRFIEPVTIGPIGDGVSLLSEPNEAGKSTVFDALHALFFAKHGSKNAEVMSLRPHSGGKVAVECALEMDGSTWRVRKEWLSGPSAKVWRDGTLAHQGDQAEDWLAELVAGKAGGPGGLLWVRQGRVSFQAPSVKKDADRELAERRTLLTAFSGAMDQVTGGERMDAVLSTVEAEIDALQTATGKARGRWAGAVSSVDASRAKEADLSELVEALHTDLQERRRLEDDLERLEDPETLARWRSDLAESEQNLRDAEDQVQRLATAEMQAKLARQTAEAAHEKAHRIKALREEHEAAIGGLDEAKDARETARKAEAEASGKLEQAQADKERAKAAHRLASEILRKVDLQERREKDAGERDRLRALIDEAEAAEQARVEQVAIASAGPDAASVEALKRLERDLEVKRLARAATAPRVSAEYLTGAKRLIVGDRKLDEGETLPLPEDGQIKVPAIGTLRVTVTDREADEAFASAKSAMEDRLRDGGWPSMAELRAAAIKRAEAEAAAETAKARRGALAPDGIPALKEAIAALGSDEGIEETALPGREEAESDVDSAVRTLDAAEAEMARFQVLAVSGATANATAMASEDAARRRFERAEAEIEGITGTDTDEKTPSLAELDAAAKTAQETFEALKAKTPDVGHLTATRDRRKAVVENAARDAADLKARIGTLSGRIEARGEEGVEESLEEVRDRLLAEKATLERVAFEKDVLVRLRDALQSAQKAARDAYFAPVSAELRPLLADLWDDAEIRWSDDTLLPERLVRRGTEESVDVLSGGTQEQIAFLVRLAFARLLSKAGRHTPLILDDALVYSDDDRIEKMFDALHHAAGDLQIIVLSCRQRAFRDLGAPRLKFQTSEAANSSVQ